MTDPQRSPGPDGEAPMPRWVYAVGIVVILLVLMSIGMHFAGGGIPTHLVPR